MTRAELKFHIGGCLVCPTRYKRGDLKGTMNYERTVLDIMYFVDTHIKRNYTPKKRSKL
ncbi:unnamed protein product [marine sediment metagenome]|uniref:Uncharacterized protein n=1 Tax=marine sediment metagenome TaxID=412755 RepID=X1PMB1_9ZZZZ